jgi:hypothetical protein
LPYVQGVKRHQDWELDEVIVFGGRYGVCLDTEQWVVGLLHVLRETSQQELGGAQGYADV